MAAKSMGLIPGKRTGKKAQGEEKTLEAQAATPAQRLQRPGLGRWLV